MDKHLDRLLDAYRTPAPSAALRERVLAAAPKPRRASFDPFWWASGAGLAAAGVAGLMFGATLTAAAEAPETLLADAVSYDEVLDGGEVAL